MKTKNEIAEAKIGLIKRHYEEEAKKWRGLPQSTMEDLIIRKKEWEVIESVCNYFIASIPKILDVGCGNGYTLSRLSNQFKHYRFIGMDASEELLKIAVNRKLNNCTFKIGDCRLIHEQDNSIDLTFTERCLINLVSWEDQKFALNEIHRILKPKGKYLMIECFDDGLRNNNLARKQCGLPELHESKYNTYINKEEFLNFINDKFKVVGENYPFFISTNYFSSHYFVARVLHPLLTKSNIKNSEFVKFFSELQPMGNYAPLQVYILEKI